MIAVVGAGVVGLACAKALLHRGQDVVVLERHRKAGLETSTHNSGVIHAGLYYPPGTLKATLCIEGRDRLKAYCLERDIPHYATGKLIVATDTSELADVDAVAANATACGASVEVVDAAFVRAREPHVRAVGAVWSPDTAWIEAEAFVHTLMRDIADMGGYVLPGSHVTRVHERVGHVAVTTALETIEVQQVINAGGLWADEVSATCGGEPFRIYPCRGEYAELTPRASAMVNGLVYPVPHHSGHGLGVHLTKTRRGTVWLGPTIRYQDRKDNYEDAREPLEAFLPSTQRLLPAVTLDDLRLSGSGIRAKLHPPSEKFADFMIRRDSQQPWLIHAAGIDSPGLTASLAIGEYVAALALR